MIDVVIDLSHHNDVSDFKKLYNAGIMGVLNKATEGNSYTDPTYKNRNKEQRIAGLMSGAYHFANGKTDSKIQADYFLSIVNPDSRTLLALDLENTSLNMSLKGAENFVTHIKNAIGKYPLLY